MQEVSDLSALIKQLDPVAEQSQKFVCTSSLHVLLEAHKGESGCATFLAKHKTDLMEASKLLSPELQRIIDMHKIKTRPPKLTTGPKLANKKAAMAAK